MAPTSRPLNTSIWYYFIGTVLPAALVVTAISVLLLKNSEGIVHARSELEGMRYATRIHDSIVLLQELRGLSRIEGADDQPRKAAFRILMEEIIEDPASSRFEVKGPLEDVREEALVLLSAPTGPPTLAAYTALIGDLCQALLDAVDRSGLVTDPSANTYYFMRVAVLEAPRLIELLGQLRAVGSGLLGGAGLTVEDERLLERHIAVVEHRLDEVRSVRRVESVGWQLSEELNELEHAVEAFLGMVRDLRQPGGKMSPSDYYQYATDAMRYGLDLQGSARRIFEQQVTARIGRLQRNRATGILVSVAALLAMTFFSTGFYKLNRSAFARLAGREQELNEEVAVRTRAEAALRESEARWRALVTNAPDLIITVDRRLRVSFVNRSVGGRSAAELVGLPVVKMVSEDQRRLVRDALEGVFRTGMPAAFEVEVARSGGSSAWFSTLVGPIEEEGSVSSVTLIARDVTARREAERGLQQAAVKLAQKTRHLRRVNQELEQFAYVVSHDLKAPLRAVSNLSTALEEDLGAGIGTEAQRNLRTLRERVERMHRLIEALLLYSRAGYTEAKPEPVDTHELAAEIAESVHAPPGFTIDLDPGLPVVLTDRLRLQQVLANLLTNAIKHHQGDGGRVSVEAHPSGNGGYEFAVSDDGPGIDARFHGKVFEVFETLEPAPDRTGIGLALVKKIVEARGGYVTLESAPGKGSTFRFYWPDEMERGAADVQEGRIAGG